MGSLGRSSLKIQCIKIEGGGLLPYNERELERMKRFKNEELYEVEIKATRDPAFHRKMFAFFSFCFEHWAADKTQYECMFEHGQFEVFRKNLTVFAGYYEQYWNLKGEVRVEAKSLSYAAMEPEEFEQCYNAMINAAIKHVFAGTNDENILNQLRSFF